MSTFEQFSRPTSLQTVPSRFFIPLVSQLQTTKAKFRHYFHYNSVTLKLTRLTLTCAATRNGETTTTHVDLTRYVIGMCILHGYSVTRKSNTFNNGFVINRWRGNFRSLLLIPLGLYTGEQTITAACCTQALVYPKSLLELRLFIFGKLEMYRITDSD